MHSTISIDSLESQYPIAIGAGIVHQLEQFLGSSYPQIALISDANVYRYHGEAVGQLLEKMGALHTYLFKPGEASKTRLVKEELEDQMLSDGLGRDTLVVGLGGGITTDLAGFVAGTFLRGVPWVALPTSLLAAVDASVGGKVGVNTPHGKNLIGLFYQPQCVLVDLEFIQTLPSAEVDNGLAEMVKHGVIFDRDYFDLLISSGVALRTLSPDALRQPIVRSVEIKAAVVSEDPREGDFRQILNGGHTIAHAIEKVSRFQVSHGRAVAMGLSVEAGISEKLGLMSVEDKNHLRLGLGTLALPQGPPPEMDAEDILEATKGDKKGRGGQPRYALAQRVGKMSVSSTGYARPVPEDIVIGAIEEAKRCSV